MNPPPATLLDRYRVLAEIGRGGQGAVFQVEGPHGVRWAAKVARLEATAQARLKAESAALQEVRSPFVVRLVDKGQDALFGWVQVMELIPGSPLTRLQPGTPFWTARRVNSMVMQLSQGLAAIHLAGFLMRDFAPGQVLVCQEAGKVSARIVDLGYARSATKGGQFTDPGSAPGTPGFTAPEWVSVGTGDRYSDTYSLAAVAWWLLAGVPPFQASSPEQTYALQMTGCSPRHADNLLQLVPTPHGEPLVQLLRRFLHPERSQRQATPVQFAMEFAAALGVSE